MDIEYYLGCAFANEQLNDASGMENVVVVVAFNVQQMPPTCEIKSGFVQLLGTKRNS